ncbi:MAG TPA: hypothetical protein VFG68_19050 [Fimbriiglobus sp.]|nr:hypothetical protein [Fimbriiglobus sp.]
MATVQFPAVVIGGKIDVSGTVDVPDGTKVLVTIPEPEPPAELPPHVQEFLKLPAIGMWKDREDMADPVEWVRKMREEEWRRRTSRD